MEKATHPAEMYEDIPHLRPTSSRANSTPNPYVVAVLKGTRFSNCQVLGNNTSIHVRTLATSYPLTNLPKFTGHLCTDIELSYQDKMTPCFTDPMKELFIHTRRSCMKYVTLGGK